MCRQHVDVFVGKEICLALITKNLIHCLHCLHRHIHYTLHLILTRAVYWLSAVLRLVLFLSLSIPNKQVCGDIGKEKLLRGLRSQKETRPYLGVTGSVLCQ